jgi:hypothetical protein
VTATATLSDDRQPGAESNSRSSERPAPEPAERTRSSVYAAYWQERSGFFTEKSEQPQLPSAR